MFTSIIESGNLTIEAAVICTVGALLFGFMIARVYMLCGSYSKSFVTTLVLLPALVEVVVMMVNGNLGTGVAVLGAFSLVRFRSVPGSSREISSLFFSMAVGLAAGMGYITFALLVTVLLSVALLLMHVLHFGEKKGSEQELKITIPENLDYTDIFDTIFDKYLTKNELERVKTTNLGSMFELLFRVEMKKDMNSKAMIDEIRCRNGNLPVVISRPQVTREEL
jgi:uncharacterized membrane protein YhiD involved in acid resistance